MGALRGGYVPPEPLPPPPVQARMADPTPRAPVEETEVYEILKAVGFKGAQARKTIQYVKGRSSDRSVRRLEAKVDALVADVAAQAARLEVLAVEMREGRKALEGKFTLLLWFIAAGTGILAGLFIFLP